MQVVILELFVRKSRRFFPRVLSSGFFLLFFGCRFLKNVNIVPDTELALQFSQKFWAPVSLTVRLVKLSEPMMDVVVLIKLVKPLLELSQDRLTVRD